MSNARQETIDHIVKEMRGNANHNHALVEVSKYLTEIADRIEAAYKRLAIPTPEQWTEIARQGAEIADLKRENDAMKRELEAGAEAAQICGEIGEMVGIEAACNQPVTDCHGLNAAAMYEALVMVKRLFDGRLMWQPDIRKAHEAVNAALAAPPRNCDRPECATTKAAQDVWRKEDGGQTAYYEWLFAEAKGYEKMSEKAGGIE